VLEDRLRVAMTHLGHIARRQRRGVALMFDEAHTVFDRPGRHQFPLGALRSSARRTTMTTKCPYMLVLCGLPPMTAKIHAARSNAERLSRTEDIGTSKSSTKPAEN
jgi:hypothetical protein